MSSASFFNLYPVRCSVLFFLAATAYFLSFSSGYAASSVGQILCDIYNNELAGMTGNGIATIAVAVVGISAAVGRVSWTTALMVGIGVAVMFGATNIAAMFGHNC